MMTNRHAPTRRRVLSMIAAGALTGLLAAGPAAADPVQARKDLTAMGLKYTVIDFSKSAGNDDMAAVKLFLDAGMDVNAGGGAALGMAAGRGRTKMVQFLLSKGAKPTSNAMQFAQTRGHNDIVKLLTEAGGKDVPRPAGATAMSASPGAPAKPNTPVLTPTAPARAPAAPSKPAQ